MKTKSFQGIICVIVFFLFANKAWAADWIYYTSIATVHMYYDKSSIKKVNKNIISVWTKTIFTDNGKKQYFSFLESIGKAPDNYNILNYQLVLVEIDCINKKYRIYSMSINDEKDSVLASLPKPTDQWIDIPPTTQMETLKNEVCTVSTTSKKKKK
jgi:hypothetical protein